MVAKNRVVKCPQLEGAWAARLCAVTAALALGCGADAVASLPPEATPPATLPGGSDADPAALEGCSQLGAADAWWNQTFSDQNAVFHAEFDATPSASSIDAVVGLGGSTASDFAQLAAIVRFNASGTIDARSGSEYRADVTRPYQAGTRYHFRLDVNIFARSYSVSLLNSAGTYDSIAREYPFRTEQAGASRLNTVASKVDSTDGRLEVCGFFVIADATTADQCLVAAAGDGFVSTALPDATTLDTVTFTATPSSRDVDAVIGLSAGPATSFSDLATAIRFAPSGAMDVRDGDGYRADLAMSYSVRSFDFRVIADLSSHTYSVYEGGFRDAVELASQFRFRTQQSAVSHLDRLAVVVDGAQGSVTVCLPRGAPSVGVVYSREGNVAVLPLAGDEALITSGSITTKVDARGRAVAQLARGGQLAVDAAGNVFASSVAGTVLTVDKYDASLAPVWTATWSVPQGSAAGAVSADPSGGVLASALSAVDHLVTVTRFSAGGEFVSQLGAAGEAVAIDRDQPIVAWSDGDTLRITRYEASGPTVWSDAFAGRAGISAMTVDPGHNVVFGGELFTAMDFGGGTLPLRQTDDGKLNAFVVKLSPAGAHVFSLRTGYTHVGGIATNGARIVVSGTEQTQFHYWHLQLFDAAGAAIPGLGNPGFGELGFGRDVAMGPSGRIWWSLDTQWPLFPIWSYMVVLAE
jgi:hypothetical protein